MSEATIRKREGAGYIITITDGESSVIYEGSNISVTPQDTKFEIRFTISVRTKGIIRIVHKSFVVDAYSYL